MTLSCISPHLLLGDPHLGLISHPAMQSLQRRRHLHGFPSLALSPRALPPWHKSSWAWPLGKRHLANRPHGPDVGNVGVCILMGVCLRQCCSALGALRTPFEEVTLGNAQNPCTTLGSSQGRRAGGHVAESNSGGVLP